jgi:hypothetical protein
MEEIYLYSPEIDEERKERRRRRSSFLKEEEERGNWKCKVLDFSLLCFIKHRRPNL